MPDKEIEEEYLRQIAASLPERHKEALVTAARNVFVQLANRKEIGGPEFAAARDVMITHFAEVNEFDVDWLLNLFGQYLEDGRMAPALKQIVATQHDPIFIGERSGASD